MDSNPIDFRVQDVRRRKYTWIRIRKKNGVFDLIAPIYGLFYDYQKRNYKKVIDGLQDELNLSTYKNIVDVGCGTGALCSVLNQRGFSVTGIDPARRMLSIAAKKQENGAIKFIQASARQRMPFESSSFDVSIAAYVAHGLKEYERKIMYAEMSRITKFFVIICDYNENRSMLTNVAEWLEGGDYFNFIKKTKTEMKESFRDIRVIDFGLRTAWYICVPYDK